MISIIMPIYNLKKYVAESIHSVQSQSYQNWELIVVDDGSTDNSVEIVSSIINLDSRIKLLKQKNQGVSNARNIGIAQAKGKYLAFLDGDDLWEGNFLETSLNILKVNNYEAVFSGYKRLLPNSKIIEFVNNFSQENILESYIKRIFSTHIGATLVEKSLIERNNIFFTPGCICGEDIEFIYKIMASGSCGIVPYNLMIYRKRKSSVTNSGNKVNMTLADLNCKYRSIEFIELFKPLNYTELVKILNNYIIFTKADLLYKIVKSGNLFSSNISIKTSDYLTDLKKSINLPNISFYKRIKFLITYLIISIINKNFTF